MERRDLFQDDLTEERYPSPARRDDAASTQVLDPDASADDGKVAPPPDAASKTPLGYPHRVPGGVHGDPETDDDEDDDDEDDEDDEE
ncbi:MAG: hypothetical protein QOD51_1664 [Candidatus Eremiobacteraeota bacterium]|nr:hypothetical protein [Candidatus Eremiobacteraeota bacterium]